jgi:hypothetical protein
MLILACALTGSVCLNGLLLTRSTARPSETLASVTTPKPVPEDKPSPPLTGQILTERDTPPQAVMSDPTLPSRDRAIRAAAAEMVPGTRRSKHDRFFRVTLFLRNKDDGEVHVDQVGYVVARDLDEGRRIAAEATGARPEDMDLLEARQYDEACRYIDQSIGQNIMLGEQSHNLGTDPGKQLFRTMEKRLFTILSYQQYFDSMGSTNKKLLDKPIRRSPEHKDDDIQATP